MGLQSKYIEFFDSMARFRVSGYKSFIWTVITYEIGWVLGLVLNYDGDEDGRVRWLIALPAAVIGLVGLAHLNSIGKLAKSMLYS